MPNRFSSWLLGLKCSYPKSWSSVCLAAPLVLYQGHQNHNSWHGVAMAMPLCDLTNFFGCFKPKSEIIIWVFCAYPRSPYMLQGLCSCAMANGCGCSFTITTLIGCYTSNYLLTLYIHTHLSWNNLHAVKSLFCHSALHSSYHDYILAHVLDLQQTSIQQTSSFC